MTDWDAYKAGDTSSRKRVIIGASIAAVVVVAVFAFARDGSKPAEPELRGATGSSTTVEGETTTSSTSRLGRILSDATSTIPPNARDPIAHPESAIRNSAQLAFAYPQSESNLSPDSFKVAQDTAKAFNLAETTGKGANVFSTYYDGRYTNTPWIKPDTYQVQYAFAKTTSNPKLIFTQVWFSGTFAINNEVIPQAVATVYFSISNNGTLLPVQPDKIAALGMERPGFEIEYLSTS